ncbi:MAG: 16S rRNA (adenine(1518)-N(6)/adenine(1519)-N(6))-dimethyltransferase [Micrococcales bacterium]|nr:16S rRNA (adenine(1518)-N(6)/adenine(1519)-N(6))-dimethyltransferase [Micrococcales bacterium]
MCDEPELLTPARVRELARALGVRPTKSLGQNFVVDAGTVRKTVRLAQVGPGDLVVEVGPGLGSLTLGLLAAGADVVAVEIDPVLARALPATVVAQTPGWRWTGGTCTTPADPDGHTITGSVYDETGHLRLTVLLADALHVVALPGPAPAALVANLPYNVAVPVLLRFLERFGSLRQGLVMVQSEVADRLVASPGTRVYGVPSAKVAWYATARRVASVGRSVFWPAPQVDSALVRLDRRDPPVTTASREHVFTVVDAAFAQRRKTLRAALAPLAGSPNAAAAALTAAALNPSDRGERLDITAFAHLAQHVPPPTT